MSRNPVMNRRSRLSLLKGFLLGVAVLMFPVHNSVLTAQSGYTLNTMPRVDVHTYYGTIEDVDSLMQIADILKKQHHINLDVFLNGQPFDPVGNQPPLTEKFFNAVESKYKGRILSCPGDYNITRGTLYTPEDIAAWQKRGAVGYKIWYPVVIGPVPPAKDTYTIYAPDYPGIDCPANEPVFNALERLGVPGAAIHIGQAHPRRWENPVHFWTAIQGWLRVLNRHPRMVVVTAYMMNLFYSDEQLDFLAWVLETHPNLYVDLGGRFGDFHTMQREHLRNFLIQYADRILYGSGFGGSLIRNQTVKRIAGRYVQGFKILETSETVMSGMYADDGLEYQGLALPMDVLEKMYYKNAMRIFPRVKTVLQQRGYRVE